MITLTSQVEKAENKENSTSIDDRVSGELKRMVNKSAIHSRRERWDYFNCNQVASTPYLQDFWELFGYFDQHKN